MTKAESADYGFEERDAADRTTFKVTPPPLGCAGQFQIGFGAFFLAAIAGGGGGLLLGMVLTGGAGGGAVGVFGLIGFVVAFWFFFSSMTKSLKKNALGERTIMVSADGMRINDKFFERRHIGEFWIQAPGGPRHTVSSGPGIIIGGTGVAGGMIAAAGVGMQAADQLGSAIGKWSADGVNKRSFSLFMRYGAKDVPVAPLLEPNVAEALVTKIMVAFQRHQ